MRYSYLFAFRSRDSAFFFSKTPLPLRQLLPPPGHRALVYRYRHLAAGL